LPNEDQLVDEKYSRVNCNRRNKMSCWWESSDLQTLVPS